jgi:hypothetical protein
MGGAEMTKPNKRRASLNVMFLGAISGLLDMRTTGE